MPWCAPRHGRLIRRVAAPVALLASWTAGTAGGQQTPRDSYYESLPPTPAITAETDASRRFHLYGDATEPSYRDARPRDGVDDRRAERLLELAEHFSPILRRNTNLVPVEFEDVLDGDVTIHLDEWRDHLRVDSGTISLGPRLIASEGGSGEYSSSRSVAPDDSLLLELLRSRGPRRVAPAIRSPAPPTDTILFIDVPGVEDITWRPHHGTRLPARSAIHAHPFVHEVVEAAGDRRYDFLIQFWFYYPYNDAANNHEGDWEHITVSVTTFERGRESAASPAVRGLLTEADLAALLHTDHPTPLDSLRIRNVAYYFHHNVMILDYLGIEAGETMWRRADQNDGSIHVWEDTRFMDDVVRRRMEIAEGRLATHPIGYIGGNSKGMDELLQLRPRFQRSYNRDSHGTYPFPGVWRKVGPLDATEKIFGDVMPALRLDGTGRPDPTLAWHELIQDDRYLVYRSEDIVLLPDWERLEQLVLEEPSVRREWAWFILPLHMGFPATKSPGAGVLKRVDLGNVAPMSPAYNTAWNRPGPTAIYPPYEPTVLRIALAPISPLASLQSGWGVFNVPIVLWSLLPGGSVVLTQVLPWLTGAMHLLGSPPARTFFQGDLPERFTSVSGGAFHERGGAEFARLLPGLSHSAVREELAGYESEDLRIDGLRRLPHQGSRAWLNAYFGPRLSMENTFGYGVSEVSYAVRGPQGEQLARVGGTLTLRELTGGLTYRIFPAEPDYLRVHARGGWAWTSYTLDAVNVSGRAVDDARFRGGRLPTIYPSASWWPTTGYAGLSIEAFTPPRDWLFNRLGIGARLDLAGSLHRLQIGGDCDCRVTAKRGDAALHLLLGW